MTYYELIVFFGPEQMGWIPDLIGCLGTIIILITYFLLQIRKLSSEHLSYSLLNAGGALMILASLMYSWNIAAVAMEGAWIVISLFGAYNAIFSNGFKSPKKSMGNQK